MTIKQSIRCGIVMSFIAASASAQSVYIDFETSINGKGGPGNGAPSSAFGGAAGVAGYWNATQISPTSSLPAVPLLDIEQQPTGLTFKAGGCDGSSCCDFGCCTVNDTDATKLLGDYFFADCFSSGKYASVYGLRAGTYKLYVYAGSAVSLMLSFPGSTPGIVPGGTSFWPAPSASGPLGVKIIHVLADDTTLKLNFSTSTILAGVAGMQLVQLGEQPTPAFCAGDASSQPCPCGNTGALGHGCASSFFASGALLYAGGTASVASDSLFLTATSMTGNVCFLLQGTAHSESPIADGLGCLGGSLLRIGTVSVAGGAATYPFGSALPISIKGLIPASGGTRYYQATYRNAAVGFCTPETTNKSNGIEIHWLP